MCVGEAGRRLPDTGPVGGLHGATVAGWHARGLLLLLGSASRQQEREGLRGPPPGAAEGFDKRNSRGGGCGHAVSGGLIDG
ncbi:hypothetical protein ABH941_002374 [Streptacidiphilus sp. EB103A]